MAGRGSFIESFPLFGYDLDDYNELFDEKLDLLLKLRENSRVTWSGRHRAPLKDHGVYPRPEREIPLWIAAGGSPESMVRAGTLGLPMALAIIGGEPERFVPLVDLYREAAIRAGHDPVPPVSINSHGWIADDSQQAADESYPSFAEVMNRIGRERGFPQLIRARFEADRGPRGSQLVGSPQQVIEKILYERELFGNDRFLLQMTVGAMPHAKVMHAIELLGTVVAPAVRKATAAPT
jgi:alkanesulfonate monooxygenase SsuD/methylene tetrahydromethanopterin reductase-like flavin-dependent oxidoreductase (luciferase family)